MRIGNSTLSNALFHGSSVESWNMTPMLVRGPVIGMPPAAMRPAVTDSRPPTIIRRVLLPQPEGPRTATNCPRGTQKLTELTASTASAAAAVDLSDLGNFDEPFALDDRHG